MRRTGRLERAQAARNRMLAGTAEAPARLQACAAWREAMTAPIVSRLMCPPTGGHAIPPPPAQRRFPGGFLWRTIHEAGPLPPPPGGTGGPAAKARMRGAVRVMATSVAVPVTGAMRTADRAMDGVSTAHPTRT